MLGNNKKGKLYNCGNKFSKTKKISREVNGDGELEYFFSNSKYIFPEVI